MERNKRQKTTSRTSRRRSALENGSSSANPEAGSSANPNAALTVHVPATAEAGSSANSNVALTVHVPVIADSLPDYPQVQFSSPAQHSRFVLLTTQCSVAATRFLHKPSLTSLGLLNPVLDLLNGTGMSGLGHMDEYTFITTTLEFFSSFRFDTAAYDADPTSLCIHFRLYNQNFEWTLATFGGLLGLVSEGPITPPRKLHLQMWDTISECDSGKKRGAFVHLPSIRYWLRLVGNTIFGRKESNNVNNIELSILAGYLNIDSHTPYVLNIAYLTAEHFALVGRGDNLSTIVSGGLVSRIARRLFPDFPRGALPMGHDSEHGPKSLCEMNTYYMKSVKWLKSGHTWKIGTLSSVSLPCTTLPAITPLPRHDGARRPPMPSYLISDTISRASTNRSGKGRASRSVREVGQSSRAPRPSSRHPSSSATPLASGYPAHFIPTPPFVIPEVFDQGERDRLLAELCRRTEQIQRDLALSGFPIYDYYARRGRLPPAPWPHPSYYRYPEGGYPEEDEEEDFAEAEDDSDFQESDD